MTQVQLRTFVTSMNKTEFFHLTKFDDDIDIDMIW